MSAPTMLVKITRLPAPPEHQVLIQNRERTFNMRCKAPEHVREVLADRSALWGEIRFQVGHFKLLREAPGEAW